jgi:hypothetical protein
VVLSFLRSIVPLAIVLSAPSPSLAQEASDSVVVVSVAARSEERSALLDSLREPLDSLGLVVRASRGDDGSPPSALTPAGARARVWIDARALDHVDIFVWTAALAQGAPAHRVIPRSGSSAVVAEEVAYVVRATLESLLREPAPVAAPPPVEIVAPPPLPVDVLPRPPPPPLTRTTGERFGFDVSAFANAQGVASSTPAFGGGLGVETAPWGARPFRPSLWIGASLNAPFESVSPEATLETTLYSVRAIPAVELAQLGRFHFAAGAGVGVDILRSVPGPGSTSSVVNLGSTTVQTDPVLEGQLLFHAPLARNAGVVIGLNVDYDVRPHYYSAIDGADTNTVFAPWAVRPSAILGLCLPLVGESACGGSP